MIKAEEKIIETEANIAKTKKTVKKVDIKDTKPVKAEKTSGDKKVKIDIAQKTPKTKTKKEVAPNAAGKVYATGKRKNAIAKVWIKKGSGIITINNQHAADYLKRPLLEILINSPFVVTQTEEKFDVICTVLGGGLSGQAGAIRHGIARALQNYNIIYRPELKAAGLLTRDSRIVERKKAGLIKARKGQVYKRR